MTRIRRCIFYKYGPNQYRYDYYLHVSDYSYELNSSLQHYGIPISFLLSLMVQYFLFVMYWK